MRDRYFPFHALGFRGNPFRALTDDEWAAIAVLPAPLRHWTTPQGHVQVLGEMGRGKTTTLLGLAGCFRPQGLRLAYEYLPEGQNQFKTPLDELDVFLLDEAQRLRPSERSRLLAAGRSLSLVLASHEDLTPLFARAGLRLGTVHLESLELGYLEDILARRLDYFALEPGRLGVTLDPGAVQYLSGTFGTDLRAMERFLYEVFQQLESPGVLTADQLQTFIGKKPIPG